LAIPTVAIVGRPNVGKSTLFNRILRKKVAVVEDVPGVTRDRNYAIADYEGRRFTLIDTGGFEAASEDSVLVQMREQTSLAIQEADVIIFVADVKEGLNASDMAVSDILRKSGKPVLYCINKVDGPRLEDAVYDFYRFGADELFSVSALHGPGFVELMDRLLEVLPPDTGVPEEEEASVHVAIIGRPNVGKSSLLNTLTGEKRAVTDNTPGTTVDSIDTPVKYYGKKYNLIDTAGIRSRGKIEWGIEKYSVIRAIKAVERCDVALLLIDAAEGVTEQDKKIGGIAHEEGKGVIIVLNKWDLLEEKKSGTLSEYTRKVREEMKFLDYAPVISISALTRQRVGKIYELIDEVVEQGRKRISTHQLNKVLEDSVGLHPPGMHKGRRIKFYYITQGDTAPPTFIVFVNRPEGVHFSYLRYLENKLRDKFEFTGNPVRIFLKKRQRSESEDLDAAGE